MVGAFTAGYRAIVTTDTGADDFGVIHHGRRHRCPGRRPGGMTGIAGIGRVDVTGTLAGCNYPIVTADTGAIDLAVVNRGRRYGVPGIGAGQVTGIAVVAGIDVTGTFT